MSQVSWASVDPRNSQTVEYSAADQVKLEQAYQGGQPNCVLLLGGNPFTIDFASMRQVNQSGGSRQVMRLGPVPSVNLGNLPPLDDALRNVVAGAAKKMDDFVEWVEKNVEANAAARQQELRSPLTQEEVMGCMAVYQHVLADFNQPKYQSQWSYNAANDAHLFGLAPGNPVPAYFSNVQNSSIYNRKLLSILGLRNLVAYGPTVFSQMLKTIFSGDASHYHGNVGPSFMKQISGNVVDLDSVIMRASDPQMVETINANLKKQAENEGKPAPPHFKNGRELLAHPEGKRIAYNGAYTQISEFIARFKMTPEEITRRHLDLASSFEAMGEIPVAKDNTTRGRTAIWVYDNVGVLSVHANVPTMSDVYGALLRAPLHFIDAYVTAKKADKIDAFFEDALSDSCFNQKWKNIEAFLGTMRSAGTIVDELNKLHASRQDIFTAEFYDADDDEGTNELAVVQRLVAEKQLKGIDEKDRILRLVTPDDVKAWHKRLMGVM